MIKTMVHSCTPFTAGNVHLDTIRMIHARAQMLSASSNSFSTMMPDQNSKQAALHESPAPINCIFASLNNKSSNDITLCVYHVMDPDTFLDIGNLDVFYHNIKPSARLISLNLLSK